MARINLKNAIKKGREIIKPGYDMDYAHLMQFKNNPDRSGAISDAFAFGYLQGCKATKAEMRKRGISL